MEGKVLYGLLALIACSTAASISGIAGVDPAKAFLGGSFTSTPGTSNPLFSFFGNSSDSRNNTSNGNSTDLENKGSPFGPFTPFIKNIAGLDRLLPYLNSSQMPGFPNLKGLPANMPRSSTGDGTSSNTASIIPPFPRLPSHPNIPGLSEAVNEARTHVQAALNISSDISTGMRDTVQIALNSENPAASVGVIMNTIAKVYSTVAAHCPLVIVGARVFQEGVRLAGEVARSAANVAMGTNGGNSNVIYVP